MAVEVRGEAFSPWQAVEHYEQTVLQRFGEYGATAVFVGTMRDFNEGSRIRSMTLEHYPGMTEKHLEAISAEARKRWDILDSLIIHRHGAMQPGHPIVLVAVWSAHRANAFDACRFLIEELKSRAPFWKKEMLTEGERWVTHNTTG